MLWPNCSVSHLHEVHDHLNQKRNHWNKSLLFLLKPKKRKSLLETTLIKIKRQDLNCVGGDNKHVLTGRYLQLNIILRKLSKNKKSSYYHFFLANLFIRAWVILEFPSIVLEIWWDIWSVVMFTHFMSTALLIDTVIDACYILPMYPSYRKITALCFWKEITISICTAWCFLIKRIVLVRF